MQVHAAERAILQAVVDQANLVFLDYGSIMSGIEKEAVKKLFVRLAHRGYQVCLNVIMLILVCCGAHIARPSALVSITSVHR